MRERWAARALALGSLAGLFLLWEAAARVGWLDPVMMPRPSLIAETLGDLVRNGDVLVPLAHTVSLFAVGYSIACFVGIGLGIAMGTSPACGSASASGWCS